MVASELYNQHYNELTEKSRKIIETSDQYFDEWAGDFETAEDFNDFIDYEYTLW